MTSTWNASLAIGIPLIDMQHQQLLEQMDALVDALKSKKDPKQIHNLLSFLTMYVNNHFGYEEQCMHIKQCPVAGQNKSAHEYFIAKLGLIKEQLNRQQSTDLLAQQVSNDLLNWFVSHIKGIDVRLSSCK